MAVYKLENGKYLSRISYRTNQGKVIVKEKRFSKRADARDFEVDFRRKLNAIKNGTLTLSQLLENQLELDNRHNTSRSIQEKRFNIETYCKKYLNHYVIDISKSDYLNMYKGIMNTPIADASKNKAIKYIKGLAKFGEDYYDFKNNAKHLQLIKKTSENTRNYEVWNVDQFNLFLREVNDEEISLFFELLFYSGLRLGEALALHKDDLIDSTLTVNKNLESATKGLKRLKTVSSKREVQLPQWLVDKLIPLIQRQGNFLFGGLKPLARSTIQRRMDLSIDSVNGLKNTRKKPELRDSVNLKIPYIRIHDLRHSHATMLLDNGASTISVSRRLGHSSIQITVDTYTHVLKKQDDIINAILSQK